MKILISLVSLLMANPSRALPCVKVLPWEVVHDFIRKGDLPPTNPPVTIQLVRAEPATDSPFQEIRTCPDISAWQGRYNKTEALSPCPDIEITADVKNRKISIHGFYDFSQINTVAMYLHYNLNGQPLSVMRTVSLKGNVLLEQWTSFTTSAEIGHRKAMILPNDELSLSVLSLGMSTPQICSYKRTR